MLMVLKMKLLVNSIWKGIITGLHKCGYFWDEDNNIFWPKKPYASWVKNTADARWQSPIGDAPALTAEQEEQNEADTHDWGYSWNEDNQSWDLSDSKA
jgi:hypothetical protein